MARGEVPLLNFEDRGFGTPARAIFDGAAPLSQGGVARVPNFLKLW